MLYDTLLVLPLVMVAVALSMGLRILLLGSPAENEIVQLDANLVRLVALGTVITFFCLFWRKRGQTLGMQVWRIKLVDYSGKVPGTGRGIVRCLGALLSAACLGLGYLWCLVDRNNRYWHDYLSRTELILLPKRSGKKRNP